MAEKRRGPEPDPGGPSADGGRPGVVARLLPTTRLEAFSDGVFAIVITLLVLEIDVPQAEENLWLELADAWPSFLGYLVSFAFIGASWIAHNNMARFMKAADGPLLRLNLVLLLFVSFLPFSTSLLATHLGDPEEGVAVVIFGTNLTVAAGLVNLVVRYATRTLGLVADDVAEAELRAFQKERRAAIIVLAVATVLGVFLPVVAVMLFLAVSVFLLVEPLWRARRRGATT